EIRTPRQAVAVGPSDEAGYIKPAILYLKLSPRINRGRDTDYVLLYLSGACGSLFKVRLLSYGYTLVAKGMESLDLAYLQHENEIYDRLQPI
ncbi:hypothetical protein TOPH_08775, partial [Tolypocladium ophioglossoides CBS 100239]